MGEKKFVLDDDLDVPVICAMGVGNNSIALATKMVQLKMPLNLILFADTVGEKPKTYAYRDMFSKWLQDRGYPEITTVQKVKANGDLQGLEEDCLEEHMLPSVAYGFKTCSQKFKIAPQDKYINNWPPAKKAWKEGKKVIKLIGIHAEEAHRVKIEEDKKYIYKYPLIEWDMGSDECKETILDEGLPLPGKSACFFCPASKKHEILKLPKDLQERAIAMERNAKLTSIKGLGRYFSWEYLIKADREQLKLFDNDFMPPDIDCVCLDGDD